MTCTHTIQEQLEKFRENWPGIKVTVYDDEMVYKVTVGWGKRAAYKANILIGELGLDIIAESSNLASDDSFLVKENKEGSHRQQSHK